MLVAATASVRFCANCRPQIESSTRSPGNVPVTSTEKKALTASVRGHCAAARVGRPAVFPARDRHGCGGASASLPLAPGAALFRGRPLLTNLFGDFYWYWTKLTVSASPSSAVAARVPASNDAQAKHQWPSNKSVALPTRVDHIYLGTFSRSLQRWMIGEQASSAVVFTDDPVLQCGPPPPPPPPCPPSSGAGPLRAIPYRVRRGRAPRADIIDRIWMSPLLRGRVGCRGSAVRRNRRPSALPMTTWRSCARSRGIG